jgi:hypothetical protein
MTILRFPKDLSGQGLVLGRLLYFFAGYTLMIKYVIPVGWALRQGENWMTYIYFWDAWWIAHLLVGRGLISARRRIWLWALLLTAAEIIIIASKFVLLAMNPVTDMWHVMWFWNKAFLLVYFFGLGMWLLRADVRNYFEKR